MSAHQSHGPAGVPCYLSLGGNLGDVAATMRAAVDQLNSIPEIQTGRLSSIHSTRPVGAQAGPRFSNAALELTTRLEPLALLEQLQRVETQLGRVRERHFGPRTIDLDILFYGGQLIDHPRLRIPHPACWYRRFVLDPLMELSPEFVHPEQQLTILQLRDQLLERPLSVGIVGGELQLRTDVCDQLRAEYGPEQLLVFDDPAQWQSAPAIIIWLGSSPDDAGLGLNRLPVRQCLDATVHPCSPIQFALDTVASALAD